MYDSFIDFINFAGHFSISPSLIMNFLYALALFFPKNMLEIAIQVAGSDPSELKELPGMVGGC